VARALSLSHSPPVQLSPLSLCFWLYLSLSHTPFLSFPLSPSSAPLSLRLSLLSLSSRTLALCGSLRLSHSLTLYHPLL